MKIGFKIGVLYVITTQELQPCEFVERDSVMYAEPLDGMYEMFETRGPEFTDDFERHCYASPVEIGVVQSYQGLEYMFGVRRDGL